MTNKVKYLFHHSFFISLCAVALCWETGLLLSFPVSTKVLWFVFYATLFTYNFYPFAGVILSKGRFNLYQLLLHWSLDKFFSYFIILGSGLAVLFLGFSLPQLFLLFLIAAGLTLLYFMLIFYRQSRRVLSIFGFIKPLLLAGTWAFVTVYFPLYGNANFSAYFFALLTIQRFLFVFMLCMIFDSRDVDADRRNGINTLANSLTKVHSKWVFSFALLMYSLTTIWMNCLWISHSQLFSLLLSGFLTWILFLQSSVKKGYFFYHFWVDGMMIFSAFAVYVATN